jgi:hypothetical protein
MMEKQVKEGLALCVLVSIKCLLEKRLETCFIKKIVSHPNIPSFKETYFNKWTSCGTVVRLKGSSHRVRMVEYVL